METAVINFKSEDDKFLFAALAKRLHLKLKVISSIDKEDYGLLKAMLEGKTGEYVDVERYLSKLRGK